MYICGDIIKMKKTYSSVNETEVLFKKENKQTGTFITLTTNQAL